jgi:hypothetical protein
MKLVYKEEPTREVKLGDAVKDFRGHPGIIENVYAPGTSGGGRGGKIKLKDRVGLFFPSVIGTEFVDE